MEEKNDCKSSESDDAGFSTVDEEAIQQQQFTTTPKAAVDNTNTTTVKKRMPANKKRCGFAPLIGPDFGDDE